MKFVALLRGINVGGNNIIKMADLKACFEGMRFANVATYIQSGNVLFETSEANGKKLAGKIEKALSSAFDYESRVVLVSHPQLKRVVEKAPRGFGRDAAKFRYDVIFLKEPLTALEAMKSVSVKEGVDTAHAGDGVLYFSRLISKATQSRLNKIIGTPAYQNMTMRNWNTTTQLLAMMDS